MLSYSGPAVGRAMKVQEPILRALAQKISWQQAAEIIGITDRRVPRPRFGRCRSVGSWGFPLIAPLGSFGGGPDPGAAALIAIPGGGQTGCAQHVHHFPRDHVAAA